MSSLQQRPCLQGLSVRHDELEVLLDGGLDLVEIRSTQFKYPFIARWNSLHDPAEESVWAVATNLLVTFRHPLDEGSAREVIRDVFFAQFNKVIPFGLLPISLPNTFLLSALDLPGISSDGPPDYPLAAMGALRRHLAVASANPDFLQFSFPTTFTGEGGCPGAKVADDLKRIGAQKAWKITIGDRGVRVAVMDTGVQVSHSALAGNILWENGAVVGYNFYSKKADPEDDNGHGTWCSGIIGAKALVGVNPRVSLLPIKFLSKHGCGASSDAIEGIDFAIKHEAQVISASWGAPYLPPDLGKKIADAGSHGILFIAGAGNEPRDLDKKEFYPAGFQLPNLLSVGGVDDSDLPVMQWGHGQHRVHLSAPGKTVCSTFLGGTFRGGAGTSAATAFVAGACALVKAARPQLGYLSIRQRLLDTVAPLRGNPSSISCTGGRLDLANAVSSTAFSAKNCP